MSRKRLIAPGFFTDADLYDAEVASGLPIRLCYAGLWTVADRRGVFRWSRNIKPDVLPYDPCDFLACLDALAAAGFIQRYTVGGKAFGYIPTFKEHQTFHLREKPSKDPGPEQAEPVPSTVLAPVQHQFSDATLTPESPVLAQGQHGASTVPSTAKAVPSPSVTGTVTGTVVTTTTSANRAKKPRGSGSGGARDTTWITPFEERWKALCGPTSWDLGPALREFAAIRKHFPDDEILRRLNWYVANRGSEIVMNPDQLARLRFVPTPRDFRLRFAHFDPSAPVAV